MSKVQLLTRLKSCDPEEIFRIMDESGKFLKKEEYGPIIQLLEKEAAYCLKNGDIRWGVRLQRRAEALTISQSYGPNPEKLICRVGLPEGYNGKILLISVSVGLAWEMTCLRSGDDWHREILKAAEEEICDLGFAQANLCPVGGAWVRFRPADGAIVIYGTSDAFGECDKDLVANMIKTRFPQWKIYKRK